MTERQQNIDRFYNLLDDVIMKFPKRTLDELAYLRLPEKAVYFFFEEGETRQNYNSDRIVRIGTHAAIANSKATLYKRLYNHKGTRNLSGNHRGSVFRQLIGYSHIYKDNLNYPHWGDRAKKNDKEIKLTEISLEKIVSSYLHTMKFTVLEVSGSSSKDNDRALIEENSIALLSNYNRPKIDNCSENWLGLHSRDQKVIKSGLWNSACVDRTQITDNYFETFEKHLEAMNNWR